MNDRVGPPGGSDCPSAAALAEYVDGTLPGIERERIEQHLVTCADCRDVIAEAAVFAAEETAEGTASNYAGPTQKQQRRPTWQAVALAGLSLAAALVIALRVIHTAADGKPPDLAPLIAAVAAQPTRLVEARLSGFPYAPPPVRTRDVERPGVPSSVRDAATALGQGAASHASSDHASGVASLALGDLDGAVASLRRAAERSPGDARAQSDLAAALIERAQTMGTREDAQAAVEACDRARAISPDLPEALFNRALALEFLGLSDAAARGWAEYVRVDPTSKWSDEARGRVPR